MTESVSNETKVACPEVEKALVMVRCSFSIPLSRSSSWSRRYKSIVEVVI